MLPKTGAGPSSPAASYDWVNGAVTAYELSAGDYVELEMHNYNAADRDVLVLEDMSIVVVIRKDG